MTFHREIPSKGVANIARVLAAKKNYRILKINDASAIIGRAVDQMTSKRNPITSSLSLIKVHPNRI